MSFSAVSGVLEQIITDGTWWYVVASVKVSIMFVVAHSGCCERMHFLPRVELWECMCGLRQYQWYASCTTTISCRIINFHCKYFQLTTVGTLQ